MATPMLRLYEHVDDYATVLAWMDEHEEEIVAAGGVLPPELDELLEQVEGALAEKVKRVALMVQEFAANAKAAAGAAQAAAEEVKRLQANAAAWQGRADSLKAYLGAQLKRAGLPRVDTDVVKVRWQTNSRASVRPVGEIPAAFRRVEVSFDGQAAYEYVKAMDCLPDKPGKVVLEDAGLVVELGEHVRIW